MATKQQTQTPTFSKVDKIVNIYTDTIDKFISSRKLQPVPQYEKLLQRPNSVRVAKVANFQIIDDKSGEVILIKDIVADEEELYSIVNKIYNYFRSKTEPVADKREVTADIFSQLKS